MRALKRRHACWRMLSPDMQALLALDASMVSPAAMLLLPRRARAWRAASPLADLGAVRSCEEAVRGWQMLPPTPGGVRML